MALVFRALIDQQAARSGFCGSGYGTRPLVLVLVRSGYDDPTDSERTPSYSRTQTHRNQTARPVDRSAWKKLLTKQEHTRTVNLLFYQFIYWTYARCRSSLCSLILISRSVPHRNKHNSLWQNLFIL